MPPHYAQSVSLSSTLGALEIGVLVSIFLFGITTAQVYAYYSQYVYDTRCLKLLVFVIWILDLGHTICISHATYVSSVIFNGVFDQILKYPGLYASVLFGSAITLNVQLFFAYRVRKLVGLYPASFCFVLSVLRFVASIVVAAEGFSLPTFKAYEERIGWLVVALFVVGTVVDILISVSLCWALMKRRHDIERAATQTMIAMVMVWTIETGLTTSVVSMLMVISLVTMPNNFVWISVYVVLAKVYSNSLLASLNSRIKLREVARDEIIGTTTNSRPIEIMRSTEVEIDSDVFSQAKYEMRSPRNHATKAEEIALA